MDYLDENAPAPAASAVPAKESSAPDLELDADSSAPAVAPVVVVDPFLQELLPEDRNARRRVVTALLRAVLAERKIT